MYYKILGVKYHITVDSFYIDAPQIVKEFPIDLLNLKNLTTLRIENNYLTCLPENIEKLILLKKLCIVNNSLQFVPNNIGKLIHLEILNLESNQLKSLPETIGALTKLKILNLKNNFICQLPKSIDKCISLTELDLSNNRLTHLSENLGNLRNITKITLDNNKIKYLSLNIRKIRECFKTKTVDLYDIDNLDYDCEIVIISKLNISLLNLPFGLKEIWLYNPMKIDIKIPFGCELYVDNIKQNKK